MTARILSRFPNAIAFSGHSHIPLADDKAIWRGAFTSIATASLSYGFWPDAPEKTAASRAAALGWEGGVPFAQGLLVDVFPDRIEIRRRDFTSDAPIGEPWILRT